MTTSESKKALRKGILAKRRNLSEEYQKQAAQEIYEKLRALEVYKEASVLCLYVPIQKEVDLFQYIPEFRADGKQIYLPRVNGNTMDFYAYNEQTALVEGAYHILEPDSMVQLEPEKTGGACLIVMRGAVFTRSCDRIGYGGGYYDRFLSGYDGYKIGITYRRNILRFLHYGRYDIPVDMIVTESFFRLTDRSRLHGRD